MKSKKPSMIIVISLVLLAAEVLWFYSSRDKELPEPIAASQSEQDNSTWQRPLSTLKDESVAPSGPVVQFSDANGYFDLSGLTVSQYVNKYREAADKGDKMAAFNVYRAESICVRIPELQQNFDAMRYSQDVTAKDAAQLLLRQAQSVCAGFNSNPKERREYLLIAAKGDIAAAQVAYLNDPPEELRHVYQRDRTDPRVVQWQKEAVGFMTRAANSGDRIALKQLATIYDTGQLVPQNRLLALTYEIAFFKLSNGRSDSTTISQLSAQMTPDQTKAAYDAAIKIVNSCCDTQE